MRDEAVDALRALNEVVERLRAPGGCPWDREQTHHTLRPYLLEETYEVLDAIDDKGAPTLREELGDLLLQVLMHCAIAQEDDSGFDIGDVADVARAKMIHRHPHVFGDVAVDGAAEVVVNWEKLKRSENHPRLSLLDGVPHALPALAFAQGVQKRPARPKRSIKTEGDDHPLGLWIDHDVLRRHQNGTPKLILHDPLASANSRYLTLADLALGNNKARLKKKAASAERPEDESGYE